MANLLQTLAHLHELRPTFATSPTAPAAAPAPYVEVTLRSKSNSAWKPWRISPASAKHSKDIDAVLESFTTRIENVLALR